MRYRRTLGVAWRVGLCISAFLAGLCGCAMVPPNSLLDPTRVGHFPSDIHEGGIRRVLSPRETPPGIASATDPTADDLVAMYEEYRLAPGDVVALTIQDLLSPGAPFQITVEVSPLGEIRVPDLGSVKVAGLTEAEVEQELTSRLKETGLLPRPVVLVVTQLKRGRVVSAIGAVGASGQYPINDPTMRLLDLIAMIGDVQATAKRAYVIRRQSTPPAVTKKGSAPPPETREGEWIIPPPVEEMPPGPGLMTSSGLATLEPPEAQPVGEAPQPPPTRAELEEVMTPAAEPQTRPVQPLERPTFEPIVIFDPQTGEVMQPQTPAAPTEQPPQAPPPVAQEEFEQPFDWEAVEELALEQRVIAIDLAGLKNGDPRQNIVVRDRDVFYVPVDTGVFYVMGEVMRPGVYAFGGRDITIKQALAICGGFSPLAWPQRCEIIRREPGTDKQYTRTVNLDAIFAGLEDDFYLRDDDVINVGTHIAAPFLYVIRNSFRFTYGFGFVYDRNFADKDAYGSKLNPDYLEQQRRLQRGLPF